jgi:hypothetical protein
LDRAVQEIGIDSSDDLVRQYLTDAGLETESAVEVVVGPGLTNLQGRLLSQVAKAALGPVVNRTIVADNGHGKAIAPPNEDEFGVFLYSTLNGYQSLASPTRLYAVRGISQSPCLSPSGQGLVLSDDEGNVTAELLPNALYIHHNVLTVATVPELAVLTAILEQAAKSIPSLPEMEALTRQEFEDTCLRLLSVNAGCDPAASYSSTYRGRYHDAIAGLAQSERNVQALKRSDERFGEEFDALRSISKVAAAYFSGAEMIVSTNTLYCVNPDTRIRHEIGAMQIHFDLKCGEVRWYNNTRQVGGHHAPHVGANGKACLGNMAGTYESLIRAGQVAAAVEAAIGFVESVNHEDSWGRTIAAWPRA